MEFLDLLHQIFIDPTFKVPQLIGLFQILVGIFGIHTAFIFRRNSIFRFKLGLVYFLPITSGTISLFSLHKTDYLSDVLILSFMVLSTILYYREVRSYTTSEGYNRHALVDYLDDVPCLIWIKDLDFKYTYANMSMLNAFGIPKEKMMGKTLEEIADMKRRQGIRFEFADICKESDEEMKLLKAPRSVFESGYIGKDHKSFQVYKAPIFVESGTERRHIGYIGIARDLTVDILDHKEIEKMINQCNVAGAIKTFVDHSERYTTSNVDSRLIEKVTKKAKELKG